MFAQGILIVTVEISQTYRNLQGGTIHEAAGVIGFCYSGVMLVLSFSLKTSPRCA
jgi:hypothetical protein